MKLTSTSILDEALAALEDRPGIAMPLLVVDRDSIRISYSPPSESLGISYWVSDEEFWDEPFAGLNVAPEIHLELSAHGKAWLFENLHSSFLLSTQLRGGSEIITFLDFFETATLQDVENRRTRQQHLGELIEGLYFVCPDDETCSLLPFVWEEFRKRKSPFFEWIVLRISTRNRAEADVDNQSYGDWITERSSDWQSMQMHGPEPTDLVIVSGEAIPLLDLAQRRRKEWLARPLLAIRPRRGVSPMLLADILSESEEASDFAAAAEHMRWDELRDLLKGAFIELPIGKNSQTALSIETRRAMIDYKNLFRWLTNRREKFSDLRPLILRRTKCLRAVHDDLLAEVEAIQSPFPFFIEHPFRQFLAASDPLQKINHGQFLMNLLIKIPTFLILEESASTGCPIAQGYLEEIREKPHSDGTLIAIRRRLSSDLPKMQRAKSVFSSLNPLLGDVELLSKLVEARNRFHHPPYDDATFLKELAGVLPEYVAALRPAFQNLAFLVPLSLEFREEKRIVKALDVAGANPSFRSFSFETRLPLESFPSDSLICWHRTKDEAVRLTRLMTIRRFKTEAIDIGIFDRLRDKEPRFSFARES